MAHTCSDSCTQFMWGECAIKQGERTRAECDLMRDTIRAFKDAIVMGDHEAERELAKDLHRLGHPDVRGLAMAVAASKSTAPKRARRDEL
jgi:hypothetical protein